MDIKIVVDRLFTTSSHIYTKGTKKYHVIMLVFFADYVSGEVKNIDCSDSKWVSLDELGKYEFVDADKGVVGELVGNTI